MKVSKIMTRDVAVIPVKATVQEAAALMIAENVGMLPVDEHDRLVGVLTDRDIVLRAVAEGENPRGMTVREVMTPEVFYCYEDASVEEAAETMVRHHVRRLPVLAQDKRLVGMLSISDLSSDVDEATVVADTLRAVAHHHDLENPR